MGLTFQKYNPNIETSWTMRKMMAAVMQMVMVMLMGTVMQMVMVMAATCEAPTAKNVQVLH